MPVTIRPARHGAEKARGLRPRVDALDHLKRTSWEEGRHCVSIIQSSFDDQDAAIVEPSSNGFVDAAIKAYSNHHHLRIRPEDVWFTILSQFAFYVNKNAEQLRHLFVAHEGKMKLVIQSDFVSRYSVDFAGFASGINDLIKKMLVDPSLHEWVTPSFSTTKAHDKTIANVLMMGITQEYFSFKCVLKCGLPSVTLLGQKGDWKQLYTRLDKLETFGKEASHFAQGLRPVIARFIRSFDDPQAQEVIDFWQCIAHESGGGSGPTWYSGWITAFCHWTATGTLIERKEDGFDDSDDDDDFLEDISVEPFDRMTPAGIKTKSQPRKRGLQLDGITYPKIDCQDVPRNFTTLPVEITGDFEGDMTATMIAGVVGLGWSARKDTISPTVSLSPLTSFRGALTNSI